MRFHMPRHAADILPMPRLRFVAAARRLRIFPPDVAMPAAAPCAFFSLFR